MKFRFLPILVLLGVFSGFAKASETPHWNDRLAWERAVKSTVDFFDRYAWDGKSYASEIGEHGELKSDLRLIVPLSRMMYAKSGEINRDLSRARAVANFLL